MVRRFTWIEELLFARLFPLLPISFLGASPELWSLSAWVGRSPALVDSRATSCLALADR